MSCLKRGERKVKRYQMNKGVPEKQKSSERVYEKVDAKFMDKFIKEAMSCGHCKQIFNLDSNKLKVHCNICNKFFHCAIARECIGEDCTILDDFGKIHKARYCLSCVSKTFKNGKCLCKDCSSSK